MVGRSGLRPLYLAVLLGTAVLITLILSGVFDPKPIGLPAWDVEPGEVQVAAGGELVEWLQNAPTLPPAYTLRLTAALVSGENDSAYGLAIGGADERLTIAVSPLGYVMIEQGGEPILPWQTWPHVRTGEQTNEIWLDVRPSGAINQLTVRLNRELLWSGELEWSGKEIGLTAESFGETAVINFQRLELFHPNL